MRRVHALATRGLVGLLLQLACGNLGATTPVSGTVYDGSGGPWALAGSPYRVTGDVTVPAGQTLTIEPGVVVKFNYGGFDLIVNGALNAVGNAGARIYFTSDRDDSVGGDTNGDGNTLPYPDLWGGLRFTATCAGGVLDYAEVRYGGWSTDGGVWIEGGQVSVTNSVLRDIAGSGIRIQHSNPTLTDNQYANNTWAAVAMDLASDPAISGATVTNNQINGLALDSGALVGDRVWDDTDLVHAIFGDITVPAGQTLTLAPGLIVKAEYGAKNLIVDGRLQAQGTAVAPIHITALRDDGVGGDTDNNGANAVYAGLWGSIRINASSTGTIMNHVAVCYGGWGSAGNLRVDRGELTLTDSLLRSAAGPGLRIQQSNPVLTGNTYQGNTGAAISMDLASDPDIDGVTVSGNGTNGLVLDAGTLARSLPWDDPDIVYVFNGDITVPVGTTLSIAAGQIIKIGYGSNDLMVQGALLASGTASAGVEFTSDRDDTVGGDTNGFPGSPSRGLWGGIRLTPSSTGTVMEYCRVSYGGWDVAGEVEIDQAGARLEHCTVRQCYSAGIRIKGAAPVLQDTVLEGNGASAMSMNLAANPEIHGVTMENNVVNGLTLDSGTLPGDAFWDDPDIVYRLAGDVTVPAGTLLRVAAGQIVKFAWGGNDLYVQGTLWATGTAGAPIVFTSELDDVYGGDTNNAPGAPYAGVWGGLEIQALSTGSILENVMVRYGGWSSDSALSVRGGEAIVAGCTVYRSAGYGLRIEQASPVIADCTFQDNVGSAVSMDLASDPTITAPTLLNNGVNGLRLDAGALPSSAIWDDTDIVHVLTGDVNVAEGSTLTLAPGLVVKVVYGGYDLMVAGTLVAEGTVDAPIVFTSDRDDSVGGDTNNGPAGPYADIWGGLWFGASSHGSTLRHVDLRYGGWGTDGAIIADGCQLAVQETRVTRFNAHGLLARNGAFLEASNCLICRNDWTGAACRDGSVMTVVNCTLTANGYGAYVDDGTVSLRNSLATGNTQGGVFAEGTSAVTVAFCDVYNPGSPYGNYRNTADRTGQNGNVSADPLYVDAAANDYRLRDGSPATDAGTSTGAPARDILGLVRYDHPGIPNAEPGLRGYYDMGAFEYGGLTPLDVDLVTSQVTGPATGTQDGTIEVAWRVTNAGSEAATRAWIDAVYLSTDGEWSEDDRLVGALEHSAALAAGAFYDATLSVVLQGVRPGDLYFIVVADARSETLEGGSRDNNGAASSTTASFTMPRLVLGSAQAGVLDAASQARYYQVLVPSGSNLRIVLDDADDTGLNELYLSRETPPAVGNGQFAATGQADLEISVPAAAAGEWYVCVHNAFGTGTYTILAEATQLGLYAISPEALGNAEEMSVVLSGAGFVTGTTVALVASGGTAYPGTVAVHSFRSLTATFAAGAVPPGVYSVRVDSPAGDSVQLVEAFEVLAGGEASFAATLVVPAAVGYHQLATLYVDYRNTGTLTMAAPMVMVTAFQTTGGSERRAALLTLDSQRLSQGFWTTAVPDGFSHSVSFLASGTSPGRLGPGESGRMPVYYAGWLKPWDFAYPPIRFALAYATADNSEPADWSAVKPVFAPAGIEAGAWEIVWSNFTASAGSTWGSFVARLSRESARLHTLGRTVTNVDELMASLLKQAEGVGPAPFSGGVADLARPAPGIPLVFWRLAPNTVSCRWRLGPLGRGWYHNWEIQAETEADGTVAVTRHGFMRERYQPDARGGYLSEPGNGAVLAAAGDELILTGPEGIRTVFDTAGRLRRLQDLNGNTITASHTGAWLTRLEHSCGLRFEFSYDGDGRLTRVAEPSGEGVTFSYDASRELLTAADYSDGRRSTYATAGTTGPGAYALARLGLPDGTGVNMGYDAAGRMASVWRDGQAPHLSYAYPADGMARVSRGTASAEVSFDDRGMPGRLVGPDGGIFAAEFDVFGNLARLTGPDGRQVDCSHNRQGLLTACTGSLGYVTRLQRGAYGRVTAVTDSRGNVTGYEYDAAGNPVAVRFPDGTSRSYLYDAAGDVSAVINRRGNVTTVVNDATGRPTAVSFTHSPGAAVSYTPRGAYKTLTDRFGATTFSYDEDGWLRQVDLPGGRQLEMGVDGVGRRTGVSDDTGFEVRYTYDAQGRMESVTAAGGAPFVTYQYDLQGRLSLETRGNGTVTAYSYDANGRVTGISHRAADNSALASFTYTYDAAGQTVGVATPDGTWTLAYDGGGRLVQADRDGATPQSLSFQHDSAGNCTARTVNGVPEVRVVNTLDQITAAGATAYSYDADGNLTAAVDGVADCHFTYDELNRVVTAQTPAADWAYEYDGFGRCGATVEDGVRTEFSYDPQRPHALWAERDGTGALQAHYVHGIGLVCQVLADGTTYYYDFDVLGSAIGITDPDGLAYVNRYAYTPFGDTTTAVEGVANRFHYIGRWGCTTDGSGLVRMGARSYHPGLGRFVSPDPYGQRAGINLYLYAANNPLRYIDPSGHAFDELQFSMFTDPQAFIMEIVHYAEGFLYQTTEEVIRVCEGINPNFDGYGARQEVDRLRRTSDFFEDLWCKWQKAMSYADDALTAGFNDLRDFTVDNYHRVRNIDWRPLEAWLGRMRDRGGELWDYTRVHGGAAWDSFIAQVRTTWESWNEQPVAAVDPNAKTGPAGLGAANFVRAGSLLSYRVDFENDDEAAAPAQVVTIRDTLSADLDWATLELTEVGFGDTVVAIPAGARSVATDVPITFMGRDLEVHIDLRLDLDTGDLTAIFSTLDPGTGLPPTADLGFLPPEDGSGRGQGHLSFVILPRPGQPTGKEIRNIGVITFDFGEVIATNQVDPHDPTQGTDPTKEALVTIDADVPASQVEALPALSPPGFAVSWSGSDGGAGIATCTIYVQDNGGAFVAWLTDTALTTAAYPGVPGHTYGFYSIATDGVGYEEEAKTAAETSTTVAYTVVFEPSGNGSLEGTLTQYVAPDGVTTPVQAEAAEGYRLRRWTVNGVEYGTDTSLVLAGVHEDMTVVAEFEADRCTVTFLPGEHGTLPGGVPEVSMTVNHGDPAPAPPAVTPAAGWRFTGWEPELPNTITEDWVTTARYQATGPTVPEGEFGVRVDPAAVAAGAAIWPLSGAYEMGLAEWKLTMDLVHDSLGRIGGEGAFAPDPVGAETYAIPLAVRGTCRGNAGDLVVRLTLTGQRGGTPTDPQARAKVAITMTLSLDTAGKLTGNARVNLALGAARQAVTVGCSTDLPQDVDGTYALLLDLTRDGTRIEGEAWLTLSNHAVYELRVRGRYNGGGSSLKLSGAPGDPAAKGLRLILDVITLDDRSTTVRGLSGTAFGQGLWWSP